MHHAPFRHRPIRTAFRPLAASVLRLTVALLCAGFPGAALGVEDDEWGGPETASAPTYFVPPLPAETSRKVQDLKAQGNKAYRAGKFADACLCYREASLLDADDAGLRNDLGICYQNLGRRDSALQSTRDALRLADRGLASASDYDWSFPDLRERKTAYFNLDKLGGPMKEPRPGQCETWSSFSNCGGRYHVCAEEGNRPVGGGLLRWGVLRVGLTRARALFAYDEVEAPSLVPRPEMRDMEALSLDGMSESRARWINRDSSVVIPLGEVRESADSSCAGNCGSLERVLSECRVVHFDPCAGVVGVACGIQEGENGDRIVISEFYLIPAE